MFSITPRKFNIAPENWPSQKESSLPTIIFQGRAAAVKFRGCRYSECVVVYHVYAATIYKDEISLCRRSLLPNLQRTTKYGSLALHKEVRDALYMC